MKYEWKILNNVDLSSLSSTLNEEAKNFWEVYQLTPLKIISKQPQYIYDVTDNATGNISYPPMEVEQISSYEVILRRRDFKENFLDALEETNDRS